MAVLCQLADPANYNAFSWDYIDHAGDFAYWLDLFANFHKHLEAQLREDGLLNGSNEARWQELNVEYQAGIAARRNNPGNFTNLDTVHLCRFRQATLDKYGFSDLYEQVKQRENETAAAIYPQVIKRIDEIPKGRRWEMLFRGLFAGNLFDLGSPKSIEMYKNGQIKFESVLNNIPQRPWFIDDMDRIVERMESAERWRQALFFVDNAGSDIVLGVLPLVREMARTGIRVVLAANSTPALNDITIDELIPLMEELAGEDPVLADLVDGGQIAIVDSGGDIPLIDLSRITDECNAAAADSDLIVLEGMGRGVESNWHEKFKCDAWHLALIKDEIVARWIGSKLFDPVCRMVPTG